MKTNGLRSVEAAIPPVSIQPTASWSPPPPPLTSINAKLLLEVAEEVSEVDVKEVSFLGDHDII